MFCFLFIKLILYILLFLYSVHLYNSPRLLFINFTYNVYKSPLTPCLCCFIVLYHFGFGSKKNNSKISQPVLGNYRQWIIKAILPVWHHARKQ